VGIETKNDKKESICIKVGLISNPWLTASVDQARQAMLVKGELVCRRVTEFNPPSLCVNSALGMPDGMFSHYSEWPINNLACGIPMSIVRGH